MIDKPKGMGEKLLDRLFAFCRRCARRVQQMMEKPRQVLSQFTGTHPLMTKILTASFCVAVCGLVIVGFSTPKQVTVLVDDSVTTTSTVYKTTCRSVDDFLETHEVDFVEGRDLIDAQIDASIEDGMMIHITKEFEIQVTADGQTKQLIVLPSTVGDILKQEGIVLTGEDFVEPELSETLAEGDHIKVHRVTYGEVTKKQTIDFQVVYQADNTMTIGDMQVTQKGRKGKEAKTYKVTYVDGEETDQTLIKSKTVRTKKDKIISYGTKISFSKPEGLKYQKKYTGVRAVSYHFSGTPVGAYGLPCEFGTVAVDQDLIPLGSLLYIEGYGYAIANDVGSAIHGKTVDLYMEKFEQCILWGARWTTVYVIDEA